ncbi:PSD1 and planctomycete cytochrome C domain-containing protein [Pelagicoccus mobilis]|uniref:PSD1 domain-containing protein n=1 Tax=Pelagicoccus mobilis TaxID=415221 RepID=A0A934VQY5_9BACT|nr:PSD1 and planctomycete cytochrome C domain-containing protein [Pelagicoccus mobilis]MBK1877058.1 PSD1 domain-containing protein [Pelagicoccus mobilis]
MNEFQSLVNKMLEGELSDREAKKLHAILETDPEARKAYVEQCHMHAFLAEEPSLKGALAESSPIDPEESPKVEKTLWGRIMPQIGVMAASVAISVVGILTVLNFTGRNETELVSEGPVLTPEAAYEKAEFPNEGNLKRPPTNFAVISKSPAEDELVSFNHDIRPILSENCYHCHGPDASSRKADLRLDIEANAFQPHGKFEAPIVAEDPESSPLYQRIVSTLKSEVMPPPDTNKTLTEEEKDLVKRWIEQGANWEGHWAFEQPSKQAVPDTDWGVGEIDAFIAARHDELGLKPNPEADRETLARRLSLDLTGLPPSPEMVEAFVSDKSYNAYEKYVDVLLASPAYGEHQARYWLDAARYSDTHGLHLDNYREIWPYRDWVINAFNDNKPYDDFTVEQIAGDLLPNATQDQIIATGFNRCNPTTSEGGAIDEEYRTIYAKDRVETTSTVFLGLTMGCASCHDHKFDPVSMEDFYKFSAFFNNLDGPIMDGNARDTAPVMVLPTEEYVAEWPSVESEYDQIFKLLEKIKKENKDGFEDWLAEENKQLPSDIVKPLLISKLAPEAYEQDEEEKKKKPADKLPEADVFFTYGQSFEVPDEVSSLGKGDGFILSMSYLGGKTAPEGEYLLMSKFDGDRGYRLYLLFGDPDQPNIGRLRLELVHSLKSQDMISVTTKASRYAISAWGQYSLRVSYDGSGDASGVAFAKDSKPMAVDGTLTINQLTGDFSTGAEVVIGSDFDEETAKKTPVVNLAYYSSEHPFYALSHFEGEKALRKTLEKDEGSRKKKEKKALQAFYFDMIDPERSPVRKSFVPLENKYRVIYDHATVSLVMKEKADGEPHAFMLSRGDYEKKGDRVLADIPSVFGTLGEGAPNDRLGLARWLVSPENPLTSRVTVNRYWQNLFGRGLVETSEDFGIMGSNPSHPELLDWLAVDFQENGWDLKSLIKKMVMSSTYRQDSRIDPEELEADPDNIYLARGARYRLDGEVLRDQALAVSGALNDKVGGVPVKPYQPKGIWNAVAYSGSNTRFYKKDEGDAVYRRSLYTFWKRTAPPPNMVIFDAPSRENCSVRRERTNTPLQALTLMNDPQYVEAARMLAQRSVEASIEGTSNVENLIGSMYRFAFGSELSPKHKDVLLRSYKQFLLNFQADTDAAKAFLEVGDSVALESEDAASLASLTMVASQIMNLDSFINKY